MTGLSTPDRPLRLDTRRLHRQPGASLRLTVDYTVPDDVRNDVIAAVPGSGTEVAVLLESVLDGIWVTASADVPVQGTCVRCLDPIERTLPVEAQQFFAYPGAELPADEDSDVAELHDQYADIEPAFRDAVLLALPLSPTCAPDCPGLCPECGQRLADDPDHKHDTADPRWSALASWREPDHPSEGD